MEEKLFGKWPADFEVQDPGLKRYMNIRPYFFPRTSGRFQFAQFQKSKINIVERYANKLMVAGHQGKKHKMTSGHLVPEKAKVLEKIKKAFELIEKKLNKNPYEVFVRAVENAAIKEEVTSFQVGGIMARKAVVTSPLRRIDKTLRYLAQGAYHRSYGKGKAIERAIMEEILGAYNNNPQQSMAIREKERIEKEAAGAR